MNPEHDDKNLNAAMNSWRAPPLSPWFTERMRARLADQAATLRREAWPWPPVRVAAASVMAAALGCMLAFVVPVTDETLAGQTVFEQAGDQTGEQVLSDRMDDSDDMIALLW